MVKAVVGANWGDEGKGKITDMLAKQNREKQEKEEAPRKPTTKLDKSAQQGLGELVWGSFFSRKHFALRPGSIWIGRKDQQEPSELQLNDGYASSRSVLLDVI